LFSCKFGKTIICIIEIEGEIRYSGKAIELAFEAGKHTSESFFFYLGWKLGNFSYAIHNKLVIRLVLNSQIAEMENERQF
jgi:hypothetical protein